MTDEVSIQEQPEMAPEVVVAASKPQATSQVPVAMRMAHEIQKPKDWQVFQRHCVVLYRDELKDPNVQQYGRQGQNQRGIDLLGRRNADPDHKVAIQCRKIEKPIKETAIRSDCERALELEPALKEIIFATTAKDDVKATDAGETVEKELREKGFNVQVIVYGWESLCERIALHDDAYNLFVPSAAVVNRRIDTAGEVNTSAILEEIGKLHAQVASIRQVSLPADDSAGAPGEDATLHGKIDAYRDLLRDEDLLAARRGLLALQGTFDPSAQVRADFRITTNLAAVEQALGNEAKAAVLFEEAYKKKPDDPKAVANLGLARLIQGRADEAFALCQRSLDLEPDAPYAVGYMLQAAARTEYTGDPEDLIPTSQKGRAEVDLGLAEFWRVREAENWQRKVIDLTAKHPDKSQFRWLAALAILSLAADNHEYLSGGHTGVTPLELDSAATELKESFYKKVPLAGEGVPELWTSASNAALALRLSKRFAEAQAVLEVALDKQPEAKQLKLMLGLVLALQKRRDEAIATLSAISDDGEAAMLLAELIAESDPVRAFEIITGVPAAAVPERMKAARWQIAAELAIKAKDEAGYDFAISELREAGGDRSTVALLSVEKMQAEGKPKDEIVGALKAIAEAFPEDTDISTRVLVAEQFLQFGRPLEASRLLDAQIDLSRMSIGTATYLRSLGLSRRDSEFRKALRQASSEVRSHPDVLWLRATHAWNVGDLHEAELAILELSGLHPSDVKVLLFKIDVWARQNKSVEILDQLEKPIEGLAADLQSSLRVASILGHFGFHERAAALAYKSFLGHRDKPRAWMTLAALVLRQGAPKPAAWQPTEVGENCAVEVEIDGQRLFFVIEPDPELRKLDSESWEPSHEMARSVLGKKSGESFTPSATQTGIIKSLRHKYIARFHFILEHYEHRFPTIFGFRSFQVDAGSPTGLDEIKKEAKSRHDWLEGESIQYAQQDWLLSVLAMRVGGDAIDAAGMLQSFGLKQKVAEGIAGELEAACSRLRDGRRHGCVIDLWTFWTAWKLKALDIVQEIAGPIMVPQGVVDTLRTRRETISQFEAEGQKSIKWAGSELQLSEASPEEVATWGKDIDAALAWLLDNNCARPVHASDNLPTVLLDLLTEDRGRIFDEIVLALDGSFPLVSDDLLLRVMAAKLGVSCTAWLQAIFLEAHTREIIDMERYSELIADLIESGQSFIAINSNMLISSIRKDVRGGSNEPGRVFRTLLRALGGERADVRTHLLTGLATIFDLWRDGELLQIRTRATGLILEAIIRERKDYRDIIGKFLEIAAPHGRLAAYLKAWVVGHFMGDLIAEHT